MVPSKCPTPKDTYSILFSDACNVRSNRKMKAAFHSHAKEILKLFYAYVLTHGAKLY